MNQVKPTEAAKEIPKLNIYQKIHAIIGEIKEVKKRGVNTSQNYNYAKEADFVDTIKPLLLKYGLIIIPNMKKVEIREYGEKATFLTTVEMEYKIMDIESKEFELITIPGQGADRGDKGIYKALTGSKKYMMFLGFNVSTGDDPEQTTPQEKKEANTRVVTKTTTSKTGAKRKNHYEF